jgi:hypothetical protein
MKIMQGLLKKFWLFPLAVLGIALPWFFQRGYIFLTDFVWGPHITIDKFSPLFYSQLFAKILSLFLPSSFTQKIFITIVLFVVLLGGRKIVSGFVESDLLAQIVSLFFLFNPFVYDRLLFGQVYIVLAFGLLAWSVGYLLEWRQTGRIKYLPLAAFLSGLSLQFSQHNLFLLLPWFVLVPGVALTQKKITLKKLLAQTLWCVLIVLALNFHWLFAFAFHKTPVASFVSQGITRQDLIAFQTSGKTSLQALGNVVLMSGFWGKDQFRYVDLTQLPHGWNRSFLILLPLILWGLYAGFQSKASRSLSFGLLVVYLVAVGLAVGIRLPVTREVTYFLFDQVPFYKGMRETQKWTAEIIIVYGIFLAVGASKLFAGKLFQLNGALTKILLLGVFILGAPLLLWGFHSQAKGREYPKDWHEADQLIAQDGRCPGSTLFLPWHLYSNFHFVGSVVANPANQFFTCPIYQGTNMEFGGIYSNSTDFPSKAIEPWLAAQGKSDLLIKNNLNLKYIILAKEADWREVTWLDRNPSLLLIIDSATLKLYRLK